MDNNFSQEQKEQIIEMYQNKTNIDDIIKFFNTEEHMIREVLKENQIDRHYNMWSDELYARGEELYSNGKTIKDICYDLLVSPNGFSKGLDKRKIKKRTYEENNRKFNRNSNYFDNIDTPNKAYVLGLIYADGNNHANYGKHVLTIQLQDRDLSILERIKQELEYEGPIRFVPRNEKNPKHRDCYILAITDEHISEQLKKIGVVERKSLILKFPTFLRPDLIRHFVRGYFDGDGTTGHRNASNKQMAGIVGTYEFVSVVSNILHSMFVKNYIYKPKKDNDSNTYEMRTYGNLSSYKFLSWMYRDCDMKLDRKYQQYLEFCERYTDPKGRVKSL